jgi:5'-nucleotidase
MAYPIEKKLVIAVASSALFDLSESDKVYRDKGDDIYRKYQRKKENATLQPGVAFPLVRRLLRLNDGFAEADAPVEVVLLSRNDPDTGLRVVNSIEKHSLPMSRATFTDREDDLELRVAFDFDVVVADDSSEAVCKKKGLIAFQQSETDHAMEPLREGPLARFFREISRL